VYDLRVYDSQFYEDFGWEGREMAQWLLPLLQRVVPFKSLVDVGCGEGHYLRWLLDHGFEVQDTLGIEGSPAAIERSVAPNIVQHDLRDPFLCPKKYDLAVSLEVAEHLEEEYAEVFADTLSRLSDSIVMTAARPGQGGLEHRDEKPLGYWADLLGARGFRHDPAGTTKIKRGAVENRSMGNYVTPWLEPNVAVFRKE
jgi:trans-aconitate methyltransferase